MVDPGILFDKNSQRFHLPNDIWWYLGGPFWKKLKKWEREGEGGFRYFILHIFTENFTYSFTHFHFIYLFR